MEGLNPAIINHLRAQQDVGSDSVVHAHHLASVPEQRQPDPSDSILEKPEVLTKSPKKLSLLFRAALRGIRGEDHDSTAT